MRRLTLWLLTIVAAGTIVAGCSVRELKQGAAAGAEAGEMFGPWGRIIGAVVGMAVAGVGTRHVEQRRTKRKHNATIASLQAELAALRKQHPSLPTVGG